jgi:hypothetical protein
MSVFGCGRSVFYGEGVSRKIGRVLFWQWGSTENGWQEDESDKNGMWWMSLPKAPMNPCCLVDEYGDRMNDRLQLEDKSRR